MRNTQKPRWYAHLRGWASCAAVASFTSRADVQVLLYMADSYQFIRFFRDIGIDDVGLVGGKNAALGEMYRELSAKGVKVPNGFAITAQAYRSMLDAANAWEPLRAALGGLQPDDT